LGLQGTWSSTHPGVVLAAATLTAAGTYLAGLRAWRRIDADPFAQAPFLTDRHTVVLHTADNSGCSGQAIVGGQRWTIHSRRGRLHPGQRVWVADISHNVLIVEPDPPADDEDSR
jgi:membrane-bound ClpP family serine protease